MHTACVIGLEYVSAHETLIIPTAIKRTARAPKEPRASQRVVRSAADFEEQYHSVTCLNTTAHNLAATAEAHSLKRRRAGASTLVH